MPPLWFPTLAYSFIKLSSDCLVKLSYLFLTRDLNLVQSCSKEIWKVTEEGITGKLREGVACGRLERTRGWKVMMMEILVVREVWDAD